MTPGSPAEAAGIVPGDRILSLGGHELHDVIDYQFCLEPEQQTVVVDRDGRTLTLEMDSGDHDDGDDEGGETAVSGDPGIYFAGTVFGPIRTCANKCVFCFIEQVPGGLRQPLYVKDDDYRLSFLHGNFITLNNLREADLERIAKQRLSPLYVSVHATDPEVRARLMGCGKKTAARGLDNLRRLGEAGIEIHAQIVLCPGLNDGSVLERTVMDLAEEYTGVASAGIVPVAFSEDFLKGNAMPGLNDVSAPCPEGNSVPGLKGNPMPALRAVTTEDCLAVIDAVAAWQERFRNSCGFGFAYAADEFYLRASRPLPPAEYYDDFAQYENGIGIARSFVDEGEEQLARLLAARPGNQTSDAAKSGRPTARSAHPGEPSRIYLLTGTLAAGLVEEVCTRLGNSLGLPVQPLVADNHLFGSQVTVTGLLGGRDLLRTAAEAGLTRDDLLLVPASSLDSAGERFLDDLRLDELHEALECEIEVF